MRAGPSGPGLPQRQAGAAVSCVATYPTYIYRRVLLIVHGFPNWKKPVDLDISWRSPQNPP